VRPVFSTVYSINEWEDALIYNLFTVSVEWCIEVYRLLI
jgi:hypothetical protein